MGKEKARKLADVRLIASGQHGVVTRAQVLGAGFSVSAVARVVERGEWRRIHPGIFVVDPAADPVLALAMGAILRAPRKTWASHRTAAHLWGVGTATPVRPEITTIANLRGGRVGFHHVHDIPDSDRCVRRGIPVTSPERTLVDLGSVLSLSQLEAVVVEALQQRLTTASRLDERSRQLAARGRRGSARVGQVLDRWGSGRAPESVLEARMLRLLRRPGLPEPERQWEVKAGGRSIARIDFAYPQAMIAIEADGYRWHGDAARWRRDLARRNELTRLGWRVLHFTWDDVTRHPEDVAATIVAAISGRNVPDSGTDRHEKCRAT